jgi:hypothetical protein
VRQCVADRTGAGTARSDGDRGRTEPGTGLHDFAVRKSEWPWIHNADSGRSPGVSYIRKGQLDPNGFASAAHPNDAFRDWLVIGYRVTFRRINRVFSIRILLI